MVALCAAKSEPQKDDLYIGDGAHHALYVKFKVDMKSEGWEKVKDIPNDDIVKKIMLETEHAGTE